MMRCFGAWPPLATRYTNTSRALERSGCSPGLRGGGRSTIRGAPSTTTWAWPASTGWADSASLCSGSPSPASSASASSPASSSSSCSPSGSPSGSSSAGSARPTVGRSASRSASTVDAALPDAGGAEAACTSSDASSAGLSSAPSGSGGAVPPDPVGRAVAAFFSFRALFPFGAVFSPEAVAAAGLSAGRVTAGGTGSTGGAGWAAPVCASARVRNRSAVWAGSSTATRPTSAGCPPWRTRSPSARLVAPSLATTTVLPSGHAPEQHPVDVQPLALGEHSGDAGAFVYGSGVGDEQQRRQRLLGRVGLAQRGDVVDLVVEHQPGAVQGLLLQQVEGFGQAGGDGQPGGDGDGDGVRAEQGGQGGRRDDDPTVGLGSVLAVAGQCRDEGTRGRRPRRRGRRGAARPGATPAAAGGPGSVTPAPVRVPGRAARGRVRRPGRGQAPALRRPRHPRHPPARPAPRYCGAAHGGSR